eukprot:CAMPEP_0117077530 /NCGR_PEP_ID=MMETSP0472-20121206/54670_1 /TAXON_ID=693140 ORGANISM="Tiarina fusus, Strain LIS" /NCGR_SAMPLE_ID=MMETSP0472 /ASSEMBLY_ACC=CAM_ASM_000603 /LENGTH=168 /DNA_ID=CAMNT_0004803911 /DNA_START=469 /DNA_END=972 /DNA_ORIENTATION=-
MPSDEFQLLPGGVEVYSSIVVLDLFRGNVEVQPSDDVRICLPTSFIGDIQVLCLAFIDASGNWECVDTTLEESSCNFEAALCGTSNHFTSFALVESRVSVPPSPSISPSPVPDPVTPGPIYDSSINTFSYFTVSYADISTFSSATAEEFHPPSFYQQDTPSPSSSDSS